MARGKTMVPERALAAACERADVVVSERYLPWSCKPRWLKADRASLERSGGLAIDLEHGTIETVAQGEGAHGWWNPPERLPRKSFTPHPSGTAEADAAAAVIAKPQ